MRKKILFNSKKKYEKMKKKPLKEKNLPKELFSFFLLNYVIMTSSLVIPFSNVLSDSSEYQSAC